MPPIPVVVALIVRDGSVLMCQRPATKVYPLHWEFPGGKVESGESEIEALKRELKEELNLSIDAAEPWIREIAEYDNGVTYSITYFIVRRFAAEPQNLEFNEIRWFNRENLKDQLHLSGNKSILERLDSEGIPR